MLGVVGFRGQAAQHAELAEFLRSLAPHASGADFTNESVNGGRNPKGVNVSSDEGDLDIQYAVALSNGLPVRYYATGGDHGFVPDLDISDPVSDFIEPWLPLVRHLVELDDARLPRVVSISYGINEQAVPRGLARQVFDMLGHLGTRVVTVVAAGGDTGPGLSCHANHGVNTTRFLPIFPASCPFVTAVGATGVADPERAASFSSGVFSDYFPSPAWQRAAARHYLDHYAKPWLGLFNPAGRGYPDFAASGEAFMYRTHGKLGPADGTSADTPTVAAIVALLNHERRQAGRPPMGFLNPWLYAVGHTAFTDITAGRSEGCQGVSYSGTPAPQVTDAGWVAAPGWDPVTGWGTQRLDRLKRLACI